MQTTSGIGIGVPEYSNVTIPNVETKIRRLAGFLNILDISEEELMQLYADSDLDGLSIRFAEKTGMSFYTKTEGVRKGFGIIESILYGSQGIIWK